MYFALKSEGPAAIFALLAELAGWDIVWEVVGTPGLKRRILVYLI